MNEDEGNEEEGDKEEEVDNEENLDKIKREEFFPNHFLIIIKENQSIDMLNDIIDFCIQRNLLYYLYRLNKENSINIIMNDLRIYMEREPLPQNYLAKQDDLNSCFLQKLMKKRFAKENMF